MKKPRMLLANDHRIVLEGLRGILQPEFEIVGASLTAAKYYKDHELN
jgi:hypothetical protein